MHASYEREPRRALLARVALGRGGLQEFRAGFLGKCSPVHFFWGSFDLAVTRFSGRRAPPMPQADKHHARGYSHEVSSVGWWPGDARPPYAGLLRLRRARAGGFRQGAGRPAAAYYDSALLGSSA